MRFPGLEKSWILGNIAEVIESHRVAFFDPIILCCLKTGSILLVIELKDAPIYGKVVEMSLNFFSNFCVNPVGTT